VCLAVLCACGAAAGSARAASLTTNPFGSVQVATADSGETAVVWRTAGGAIRTAIGTPGTPFSAPVTIADDQPLTSGPAVAMDAAGDVVIVWEAYALSDCGKYGDCAHTSLGAFAAIRPAGAPFGAPVRLARAQPRTVADPRLAMNRAGDWVVTMNVGASTVVGAGRGATPPGGFTTLPMPSAPHAFALDGSGAATFAGVDASGRPVTVVRDPGGAFVAPQILDGPTTAQLGVRLGVGPRGDALAIWPAGHEMHWAARPEGGSFGATGALGPTPISSVAAVAVGVDGQGRTMTILPPYAPFAASVPLVVLRGTTAAPFADAETLTAPAQSLVSSPSFALGAGGTASVGWPAGGDSSGQLSVAFDGGAFAPPLGLGPGTSLPAVAVDAGGRVAAAWTATTGGAQRILAATFAPAGLAGSSIVTEAPLITRTLPPLPLTAVAFATASQRLAIRADGTVRPELRCISRTTCRGELRIDVRLRPGGRSIRLGTHRFVLRALSVRRVTVRATRAARRAALRRSLRGTITVRTKMPSGSQPTGRASVTIRRTTAR